MVLPNNIKQVFFNVLYGDMAILDFEDWLYKNKEIEAVLNHDDYIELIAYGYKEKGAKWGLISLIEKQIDNSEYEKWRLEKMLVKVLDKAPETPKILLEFYNMYCHGYKFLDVLGLRYGLNIAVPPGHYKTKNWSAEWDDLNDVQQREIINSFYPEIEAEVLRVMGWLENGSVVPLDKKAESPSLVYYSFIDKRAEAGKGLMKKH